MKKYIWFSAALILVFSLSFAGCSIKNDDIVENETTTLLIDEKFYGVEVPFADSVSSFTFDENDNVICYNNPGTNTDTELVNYSYDSDGNCICISHFDAENVVVAEKRFHYDANGFCSREEVYELQDGTLVFDYSYDYERNADGRITKITDDNGMTEEYEYDENGHCISEKTVRANGTLVAEAEFYYDENGRLLKSDSTKANCEYEYDSQGRLIREKYSLFVVEYEYCDDGSVLMYTIEDGEEKGNPSLKKEYFANGQIIKYTWYEGEEETEINIFCSDDLKNEPDPTVNIRYK